MLQGIHIDKQAVGSKEDEVGKIPRYQFVETGTACIPSNLPAAFARSVTHNLLYQRGLAFFVLFLYP